MVWAQALFINFCVAWLYPPSIHLQLNEILPPTKHTFCKILNTNGNLFRNLKNFENLSMFNFNLHQTGSLIVDVFGSEKGVWCLTENYKVINLQRKGRNDILIWMAHGKNNTKPWDTLHIFSSSVSVLVVWILFLELVKLILNNGVGGGGGGCEKCEICHIMMMC